MKRSRVALMLFLGTLGTAFQTVGSAEAQRGNLAELSGTPEKYSCPWSPQEDGVASGRPYEDDCWYGESQYGDSQYGASKYQASQHEESRYSDSRYDEWYYDACEANWHTAAAAQMRAFDATQMLRNPAHSLGLEVAEQINRENEGLSKANQSGEVHAWPAATSRVWPRACRDFDDDYRAEDWRGTGYGYEDEYDYEGRYNAVELHPSNLPPAEPPLAHKATPASGTSACHSACADEYDYGYDDYYGYGCSDYPPPCASQFRYTPPATSDASSSEVLGEVVRAALRSTSRMLEGAAQALLRLSQAIDGLAASGDGAQAADLSDEMPRPWPATLGCPARNTQHLGL